MSDNIEIPVNYERMGPPTITITPALARQIVAMARSQHNLTGQELRDQLLNWAVAWEYIADAPFALPDQHVMAHALQDGACLVCAYLNGEKKSEPFLGEAH